jgi:hypothetical protein
MRDFDEEVNLNANLAKGDGFEKFKNGVGVILVLIGMGIILWTVMKVIYVFDNPESLKGFKNLFTEPIQTTTGKTKTIIPLEALTYLIPLSLLAILLSAGNILIKGGRKLIAKNFQPLISAMDAFKSQVTKRMKEIKEFLTQMKNKTEGDLNE